MKFYLMMIPLLILALIISCGVTESEEQEIEEYFKAHINGEPWAGGDPRAVLTLIETDTLFQIFASEYDSLIWPYNEHISLSMNFSKDITEYPIPKTEMNEWRTVGGMFTEIDGDAVIARYHPIEDSVNKLYVTVEEEGGKKITTGSFAMKVVVDSTYNNVHNNKYRLHPDTLLITNGEFKVVVEENE